MIAGRAWVRPPAVAGTFYPGDPTVLAATVELLLADVPAWTPAPAPPAAVIVPHAGYVYSGPIAATAYARLRPWGQRLRRVLLVGPAHRAPVRGVATCSADAFATPLGEVAVDAELRSSLLAHDALVVDDVAHAPEHCLEVQLPFLQQVLPSFTFVPLLAGRIDARALAEVLEPSWAVEGTVVVVSSDLSHYHDHATAQVLDRRTAAAVVARDWRAITWSDACGAAPVQAVLELARRHDDRVELLDLRTSADTGGDADRVVGYGSFALR